MKLRKSAARGHADHGWLKSKHTFSFANYHDRDHMGFRTLRVINEDRVDAGEGFPTHGHRDMEILSYVLEGALEHRDDTGTSSVIVPGDVQRMSAGAGVKHSEYNHSLVEDVHFLQIWIVPDELGVEPGYEQIHVPASEKRGRLRLIASRGGRDGSVSIHQDAAVYATVLAAGETASHELAEGRAAWLQVARGRLSVRSGDETLALEAGDGVAISEALGLEVFGSEAEAGEALLFDLV